jgi:Holliday junction resolvase RusA-like endonuclease
VGGRTREEETVSSAFSVVFEGRPVPWARAASGKHGKRFTPTKQLEHRRALAKTMQLAPGRRSFSGPVGIRVDFDYDQNITEIQFWELKDSKAWDKASRKGGGKHQRPDLDNLVKQVMESAELAGIVKDDVQFVRIDAEKSG